MCLFSRHLKGSVEWRSDCNAGKSALSHFIRATLLRSYSSAVDDRRRFVGSGFAIATFVGFLLLLAYKQRMALQLADIPWATGNFTKLATVAALLIIVPWILLLPAGRWRIAGAFCLDLLVTALLYSDVLYSRQFGDLTSAFSLKYAGQLVDVRTAVERLMRPGDWRLWADLPLLLLLFFVWGTAARWMGESPQTARTFRTRLQIVFLIVLFGVGADALCFHLVGISAWKLGENQISYWGGFRGMTLFEPRWRGSQTPEQAGQLGFLNYHAFDLYRYIRREARLHPKPKRADLFQVKQWFKANQQPVLTTKADLHGAGHGKNLIILQVESLQHFVVDLKIDGQEITPNLNRLASESLRFPHFYTQVSVGMTADADLMANCSLYPLPQQVVYYDYDDDDFRCMPTLARSRGYYTVAMQGINPTFWNLDKMYPRVGFQDYYNLSNGFVLDERVGMGLSDKSFFDQALKFLEKAPQPFYAFLVTLSSHAPFNEAGIPRTLQLGPLEGTEAGDYLNAEHYTDAAIGSFVDSLGRTGLLDNSILVVYGDHFGITAETPGYPELLKLLSVDRSNQPAITDFQYRIPLLVRIPGIHGQMEPQWGGEIDIAPTLGGILGFPTRRFFFMGRDLLARPKGTVSLSNGSVLGNDFYWLQGLRSLQGGCYDQTMETAVSDSQCSSIIEKADSARRVSRMMVQENLILRLTALAARSNLGYRSKHLAHRRP